MGSRIELLSSLLLLICQIVKTLTVENSPCRFSLTVPLEKEKIHRYENGSLLHEGILYPSHLYWTVDDTVRGCICELRPCLRKCCQDGEVLSDGEIAECIKPSKGVLLPDLRLEKDQLAPEIKNIPSIGDHFAVVRNRICPQKSYKLEPEKFDEDKFVVEENGTLNVADNIESQWNYCIDWHESLKKVTVLKCHQPDALTVSAATQTIYPIMTIVSVPFLIITFLVYAIIPELRNIYGKTLMCYVACLVTAYCSLINAQFKYLPPNICVTIAFVIHYSFLASFFWLNIMCFDIWWTFSGFRAMSGSVQQRDRKKFIMYSIYAWGSASVLTGLCLIMDFSPNIPQNFIRPKFGTDSCWFNDNTARAIYFYGPMAITVLCNIFLFISTAIKIQQHKRDTAHHLKGSESRRHDDNKQWFNLYLKLFIVMGINWSMEIVSWLCDGSPEYVWYITDLANTLQGVIIFIIFVCKDKIKRLLLKRFGCQDHNILSRNSTRSVYHSSASRTCVTSASGVPLRENANAYIRREPICTTKESAEESDCA